MDGEIIHALLGLLDQRVLEHFPIELERIAPHLFQRLIDRHRADGHRRIAHDPRANVMDVAPRREVHHRIGAPADRPHQLLDLLRDARRYGGVSDIRVDLDQKIAADRHRLQFDMIDVGRDDGAAPRNLGAHEFRRHEFGDFGAEAIAVGEALRRPGERRLARKILAMRDVDHLLGDDPGFGEFVLRDHLALGRRAQRPGCRAQRREAIVAYEAVVLRLDRPALDGAIAARGDPRLAQRGQTFGQIGYETGLRVGSRRIVNPNGRLLRIREDHLAERHEEIGATSGRRVDLVRTLNGSGRHADGRSVLDFGVFVHRGRLRLGGTLGRQNGGLAILVPTPERPGSGSKGPASAVSALLRLPSSAD